MNGIQANAGGGRPVLITGASSGIGEACVAALLEAGFLVLAGVHTADGAERVRRRHGDDVATLVFDVADEGQVQVAVETVRNHLGATPLWGLVNCAGVVVPGPLELLDGRALDHQFRVNVFGPMALTRACLGMLRQSRGRLVNVSSINGRVAKPFIGAYCSSKHALEGLTDSLRMELAGSGIHVVLIEPGSVKTPIWDKAVDSVQALAAGASDEGRNRYGGFFRLLSRGAKARSGTAPSTPGDVAAALVAALTAPRPRARVVVGRDARLQLLMLALLPDAWRDALILRKLGRDGARTGDGNG